MRISLTKICLLIAVFSAAAFLTSPASAQFGGMGGGFGGMGGGFGGMGGMMGGMGGMGGGGGLGQNLAGMAGISIEPDGVLKRAETDPTGALTRRRFEEAKLKAKDAVRSPIRKISLNRLEAAAEALLKDGKNVSSEMAWLAGLTRLEYVFYFPETNDIVIAGPAEPVFIDASGEARGVDSARPTLYLRDLIVALRAYPPGRRGAANVGCSIDPTPEGLQRMQQFVKQIARSGRPPNPVLITNGIRQAMGKQDVTINGVSPKTHFASIMVAADYRMKLIGIGMERPAVKIPSYVSLVRGGRSNNALVRWYFTPNYKTVRKAADGLAMRLEGDGVKLVGADELVQADGSRVGVAKSDAASKRFCETFTRMYPELAAKEPVYAHLRNLIDMVIASAFIQQQDYYGKADWYAETFGNEKVCHVEVINAPKKVDTAVTAVRKGSRLMTPTGGGVSINAYNALRNDNLLADDNGEVKTKRADIDVKTIRDLPKGKWWWD